MIFDMPSIPRRSEKSLVGFQKRISKEKLKKLYAIISLMTLKIYNTTFSDVLLLETSIFSDSR